tara:strand:+ start:1077 stop:1526 length:450 start_codon:yes stop_codon:yes gene_type:complete
MINDAKLAEDRAEGAKMVAAGFSREDADELVACGLTLAKVLKNMMTCKTPCEVEACVSPSARNAKMVAAAAKIADAVFEEFMETEGKLCEAMASRHSTGDEILPEDLNLQWREKQLEYCKAKETLVGLIKALPQGDFDEFARRLVASRR